MLIAKGIVVAEIYHLDNLQWRILQTKQKIMSYPRIIQDDLNFNIVLLNS